MTEAIHWPPLSIPAFRAPAMRSGSLLRPHALPGFACLSLRELMMHLAPLEELVRAVGSLVSCAGLVGPIEDGLTNDCFFENSDARNMVKHDLLEIAKIVEFLGLQVSPKQARKLAGLISDRFPRNLLLRDINHLVDQIHDDLETLILLYVPGFNRNDMALAAPLGDEVAAAFVDARYDAREAWKCIIFSRSTACVFHLMRVMEHGIRALISTSFGDSAFDITNATWGKLIGRIYDEAKLADTKIPSLWMGRQAALKELAMYLTTVKDVVRNPTMHVRASYDPEGASEVFHATKIFMKRLAVAMSGGTEV